MWPVPRSCAAGSCTPATPEVLHSGRPLLPSTCRKRHLAQSPHKRHNARVVCAGPAHAASEVLRLTCSPSALQDDWVVVHTSPPARADGWVLRWGGPTGAAVRVGEVGQVWSLSAASGHHVVITVSKNGASTTRATLPAECLRLTSAEAALEAAGVARVGAWVELIRPVDGLPSLPTGGLGRSSSAGLSVGEVCQVVAYAPQRASLLTGGDHRYTVSRDGRSAQCSAACLRPAAVPAVEAAVVTAAVGLVGSWVELLRQPDGELATLSSHADGGGSGADALADGARASPFVIGTVCVLTAHAEELAPCAFTLTSPTGRETATCSAACVKAASPSAVERCLVASGVAEVSASAKKGPREVLAPPPAPTPLLAHRSPSGSDSSLLLTSRPPLSCPPHLSSPRLTSPHLSSPHLSSPCLTSPPQRRLARGFSCSVTPTAGRAAVRFAPRPSTPWESVPFAASPATSLPSRLRLRVERVEWPSPQLAMRLARRGPRCTRSRSAERAPPSPARLSAFGQWIYRRLRHRSWRPERPRAAGSR